MLLPLQTCPIYNNHSADIVFTSQGPAAHFNVKITSVWEFPLQGHYSLKIIFLVKWKFPHHQDKISREKIDCWGLFQYNDNLIWSGNSHSKTVFFLQWKSPHQHDGIFVHKPSSFTKYLSQVLQKLLWCISISGKQLAKIFAHYNNNAVTSSAQFSVTSSQKLDMKKDFARLKSWHSLLWWNLSHRRQTWTAQ